MKLEADLERIPRVRQPWIEVETVGRRSCAGEAEDERLPNTAHRRQVHPAGCGTRQVVDVDPACQTQRVQGWAETAGPSEQCGMNRG